MYHSKTVSLNINNSCKDKRIKLKKKTTLHNLKKNKFGQCQLWKWTEKMGTTKEIAGVVQESHKITWSAWWGQSRNKISGQLDNFPSSWMQWMFTWTHSPLWCIGGHFILCQFLHEQSTTVLTRCLKENRDWPVIFYAMVLRV